MRDTHTERQRHRQREAPCGEPNVGLDPRTPGSRPGLKVDAQLLSHPGVPTFFIFKQTVRLYVVSSTWIRKKGHFKKIFWGFVCFKKTFFSSSLRFF